MVDGGDCWRRARTSLGSSVDFAGDGLVQELVHEALVEMTDAGWDGALEGDLVASQLPKLGGKGAISLHGR